MSITLEWSKKDPSKLTISRPTNFNHPIHVTYDSSTGEFDGMPELWIALLQSSKITKQEQKQNPQAVLDALDFYQHAAQKRESKFMYSSYKSWHRLSIQRSIIHDMFQFRSNAADVS